MTTLRLESVSVDRAAGPVISEVTLEAREGRITAIVGPNGAGKTSLLESISGIVRPSNGRIFVDDQDVTRDSRRARVRKGIIHVEQGRAIFPSLTVQENLALVARGRGALDELLSIFPELQRRLTSTSALLSGGEQQMVVLARAFLSRPRILLVDEMSLGLAPVVFLRLLPVIRTMAVEGVSVLLVEQFAHLALKSADQALVVSGGRVTYQGEASVLAADEALLHSAYLGGSI